MTPFVVLHDGPDFVVVDKAPSIHMNATDTRADAALVELLPDTKVVHRLDRTTSGVCVLARSREAVRSLSAAFRDRTVDKEYVAVVEGHADNAVHTGAIGPDSRGRRTMTVRADGKSAETQVQVTSRAAGISAIVARPRTGRTHQIRVHLAAAGTPIVGDRSYGGIEAIRLGGTIFKPGRPLLHARRLSFAFGGRTWRFAAPLPPDFSPLLAAGLSFDGQTG